MRIAVRQMQNNDLNTVSELAMLANLPATKDDYSKHVLVELKKNPALSFVATHNLPEDIAVATECQRKGIGKRSKDEEARALKRKEAKMIFAEVHHRCTLAVPFYYSYDFRITGFAEDYFGIGHDAIILKLALRRS